MSRTRTGGPGGDGQEAQGRPDRDARLGAALRANLARRKARDRALAAPPRGAEDTAAGPAAPGAEPPAPFAHSPAGPAPDAPLPEISQPGTPQPGSSQTETPQKD